MSATDITVGLIVATAPAQTAFILLYGFGSPWWKSLLGRALFTKALGLALLVDLALLYQFFGDDWWNRDGIRLGVYALIATGAWLQLAALVQQRRGMRREFGPEPERYAPKEP